MKTESLIRTRRQRVRPWMAAVAASALCLMVGIPSVSAFSPLQKSLFPSRTIPRSYEHNCRQLYSTAEPEITAEKEGVATHATDENSSTLLQLFPTFVPSLIALGLSSPTPIQSASARQALNGDNLLLIAPTGSGKTFAYLLPALSFALANDGTVLIVAPTRELAVQLTRDATSLLQYLPESNQQVAADAIQLAVRGVVPPSDAQINGATMLIGTPEELLQVVSSDAGREFGAAGTLKAIILDEVDVLLPVPPKSMRTSLDNKSDKKLDTHQDQRRRQEQKRKQMALKRQGGVDVDSGVVVPPTERLLQQVATTQAQIYAGSATASRKTLDTLNRVLYKAANGVASEDSNKKVKVVRARTTDEEDDNSGSARAITVPEEVIHRFVPLTKTEASSGDAVMAAVARAASELKPKTALVFLCGEFGRSKATVKLTPPPSRPSKGRRKAAKKVFKPKSVQSIASPPSLSARGACTKLASHGIDAQPLHVALGLEPNVEDDISDDTPPFLVTFEGSARGLHFDAVDAVFVVGRPASAASYLHLAGRVGRASPTGGIIPGVVVSLCTEGQATELGKWITQIGGTPVQELAITVT